MSVKVKVPSQLRALTSGSGEISGAGSDVHALIEDLDSRHPVCESGCWMDSGALRRFVTSM